jgi:hypothetical protein
MRDMPSGSIESGVKFLLDLEKAIRETGEYKQSLEGVDSYWADLVRMLQANAAFKNKDDSEVEKITASLSDKYYTPYLVQKVR